MDGCGGPRHRVICEQLLDDILSPLAVKDVLQRFERRRQHAPLAREREHPRNEGNRFHAQARFGYGVVERSTTRQRLADDHLGPIFERDGREEVAVAAQPEHRPLVGARGHRDARRLLDTARDERRQPLAGVLVDMGALEPLGKEMSKELADLEQKARDIAGADLNPRVAASARDLLFDESEAQSHAANQNRPVH